MKDSQLTIIIGTIWIASHDLIGVIFGIILVLISAFLLWKDM